MYPLTTPIKALGGGAAAGQGWFKLLATWALRVALIGHILTCSNPADGAMVGHRPRWGLHEAADELQTVAPLRLAQIGGANV